MNAKNILLLLISMFIWSCSSEYGNEELISDILANKSDRIIKNFHNSHNLEKEEFKKVVESYSTFLSSSDLTKVAYDDKNSFKRKQRHGYMFLNEDYNFVASITFKYVMQRDSTYKINFIDFRNSTSELPCVKFPSRFPIKCLALPVSDVPNVDSLRQVYPKMKGDYKFHHTTLASKKYIEVEGDTLKRIIAFNNGNKIIANHLTDILSNIDDRLGLQYYTLCESYRIGEPTINLSYDPDIHQEHEVLEFKSILETTTNATVRLNKQKTTKTPFGSVQPMISIGYPLSEAQVKIF